MKFSCDLALASIPHLDVFVTVGTVVDYGEWLLETGSTNTDDISYQLTDGNYHLAKYERRQKCLSSANASENTRCSRTQHGRTHLQVRAHKRPAARVVEVTLHEEVQQMCGIAADGAQLGVTALEDFVAQRGAHVCAAVKEGAGELEGAWVKTRFRDQLCGIRHWYSDSFTL